MAYPKIDVSMLGGFSLSMGDNRIDDSADRSKKLWLLLAFLIFRRPRPSGTDELVSLLWSGEGERSAGVLKATVHRLRALLDKLAPSAGRELISYEGGCYRWNGDTELSLDTEEFEAACEAAWTESDEAAKANLLERAVELYRGSFLERLSFEAWVVPIATHFHNLFIRAVTELLPLQESGGRRGDAILTAEKAIEKEPCHEDFYRVLMGLYLSDGRPEAAVALYERLRRLLLDEFGVIPEESTRSVYRKAVRGLNGHIIHVDLIREQLRETGAVPGCMVCDYEFFKVLYRAEARAIARNGNCVHISLLTLTREGGGDLAPRSLEKAMDNMEEILRINLRKGDIISRCSASQFVMMLPQANLENSRMISERVLRAFSRRYPHSPARLDYSVWSLEPME